MDGAPTGLAVGPEAAANAATDPDTAPAVAVPSPRATADPQREEAAAAGAMAHDVDVVDHHRFMQAVCSCGWNGLGRRSRSGARAEAVRHTLAPGSVATAAGDSASISVATGAGESASVSVGADAGGDGDGDGDG